MATLILAIAILALAARNIGRFTPFLDVTAWAAGLLGLALAVMILSA